MKGPLFATLLTCLAASAQVTTERRPYISAQGTSTVKATPDQARIELRFSSSSQGLKQSVEAVTALANAFIQRTRQSFGSKVESRLLGLTGQSTSSLGGISFNQGATASVEVTISDLSLISQLMDLAATSQATQISGIASGLATGTRSS